MKKGLKKFLKFIKTNTLGFIVGAILFGSIGVYAATIASSSVVYDNTNSGSSATNVKDAIDELYTVLNNGKALVASAITNKGVNTDATSTFEEMANNIKSIQTSITPSATQSNGTSSSSVSLAAGTYIVSCSGAAGTIENYGGDTYPGINWYYGVSVSISGGSYTQLSDSGNTYNNGCGLRTITYLVVVQSSGVVTTNVSLGGPWMSNAKSSTIAVKIK